ncbi:pentapeptide repeat-containing protein [Actinoallomurus sp. NBC_01490]
MSLIGANLTNADLYGADLSGRASVGGEGHDPGHDS